LEVELLDPDDEILEHHFIWNAYLAMSPSSLPALPVGIPDDLREPPFPLEQRCQWHETPAPQVGEIRWSAPFLSPVVDGARHALPHPRTPQEARAMLSILKSMAQNLQDFPAQLEAISNSEYAQFLRQHYSPLPVAQKLESQDTHKGKVSP
jgi:hypothetical protein